jgi:molybdate transport system substrate-binding protein
MHFTVANQYLRANDRLAMNTTLRLALSLVFFGIPVAEAKEIRILSPGVIFNAGLLDLASEFTKETGVKVYVLPDLMGRISNDVKTRSPQPDLVTLPMDLMANAALEGDIDPTTFTPLGRVEIGLAVKSGAPHPDISSVDKLVNVLKGAHELVYSNPAGGMSMEAGMIDRLLKQPEFAGINAVPSTKGEGGQALARGEGDMALQLICEILPYPAISLVGPLPPELNAHIDNAVALTSHAPDREDALAFLHYITRPETAAIWKKKGLEKF